MATRPARCRLRPLRRPSQTRRSARENWLATLLLFLLITACAPDAWRPDSSYDAYLDQVQQCCGEMRIGSRSIGDDLLQRADAYFLDLTSRFYHRQISGQDYANALAGSFSANANSPAILCILNVKRGNDPLPMSPVLMQ
ncbi:MAG: hypothetical protein JNK99_12275 [Candidatus Accumulibacter sp.]|jgi:hypothetical protein|uniref:hypothetical protein n=1 Tax=Accumulibacter sp. TaxID=2053492 RepID=UPI001A55DC5D|nr:hypothetical protein [Accumulibacter sp.]MBL8395501.1 hypothetical protein [Accumulibacter sp.]